MVSFSISSTGEENEKKSETETRAVGGEQLKEIWRENWAVVYASLNIKATAECASIPTDILTRPNCARRSELEVFRCPSRNNKLIR